MVKAPRGARGGSRLTCQPVVTRRIRHKDFERLVFSPDKSIRCRRWAIRVDLAAGWSRPCRFERLAESLLRLIASVVVRGEDDAATLGDFGRRKRAI